MDNLEVLQHLCIMIGITDPMDQGAVIANEHPSVGFRETPTGFRLVFRNKELAELVSVDLKNMCEFQNHGESA